MKLPTNGRHLAITLWRLTPNKRAPPTSLIAPSGTQLRSERYFSSDYDHHGHNPGPPITYDYMPIPSQSFKRVHGDLQKKFNLFLLICMLFTRQTHVAIAPVLASTCLAASIYFAYVNDTFEITAIGRRPESWRNRNKTRAGPAEEAPAA